MLRSNPREESITNHVLEICIRASPPMCLRKLCVRLLRLAHEGDLLRLSAASLSSHKLAAKLHWHSRPTSLYSSFNECCGPLEGIPSLLWLLELRRPDQVTRERCNSHQIPAHSDAEGTRPNSSRFEVLWIISPSPVEYSSSMPVCRQFTNESKMPAGLWMKSGVAYFYLTQMQKE